MPQDKIEIKFAEVEYGGEENSEPLLLSSKAQDSLQQAVLPQGIIPQRAADPIRQKFHEMRRLNSENINNWHSIGNEAKLFYTQAKFMEDFTDNHQGNTPFSRYYPSYQHMGYEQLRTYFTWRTNARNGEFAQTSTSYIFVYIYELLHNIGVESPQAGLDKLLQLWNNCPIEKSVLSNYLPKWLKDYHVYYHLPTETTEISEQDNAQSFTPESFAKLSSYDIAKSKFYTVDNNDAIFNDYLSAVIINLQELCALNEINLKDLIINTITNQESQILFRGALFFDWMQHGGYSTQAVTREIYYVGYKDFIAYIIKKTEEFVRKITNFKHKITVDDSKVKKYLWNLRNHTITLPEITATIQKAIENHHRELTQIKVTINQKNLAKIRTESNETQEKLIIEETEIINPKTPEPTKPTQETTSNILTLPPTPINTDIWTSLKSSLSDTELKTLELSIKNPQNIKQFADENGIMLEVLTNNINEKAFDIIGDSILDDELLIYEDYLENISKMLM